MNLVTATGITWSSEFSCSYFRGASSGYVTVKNFQLTAMLPTTAMV